ncbi:MAG TPA: hypothetical protein VK829_03925 [Terriglobales bacterium]|nr:hypothetical protein [Terriglobales bacterium]
MLKHGWLIVFVILCSASRLPMAAGQAEPAAFLGKGNAAFMRENRLQGAAPNPSASKKSCSEVYPTPEAAKHWTDCKQGQYSQCGGPDDCGCQDGDDRLIWYDCKEGSYALCEDDNTCKDSS